MESARQYKSHAFKTKVDRIAKAFRNETFLYILKRILSALLTTVLIVAVVTALISLFPDEFFYNRDTYNRLRGTSGEMVANSWRTKQLFLYGRVDRNGNKVPVLLAIGKYIYWLLPIKKKIPIRWDAATQTMAIKWWEGFLYFGRSANSGKYITDLLKEKMGISMIVSLVSVFFAYLLAYPFGIAMAKKPGGTVDKIGNVFIVLNYAIPGLVFYLFMQQILGKSDGIFGFMHLKIMYEEKNPRTLVAPIACIVFLSIPGICIWLRRFMVDELSADYVKFARSKGLSENRIMYTHVLRNAIVPLVRNIPATFIASIVGSYFVESIWGIPGTGRLLIDSLQSFDVPAIQGLTVIYALLGMISFLLGDIVTVFFDPRIKLRED